MEPITEFQGEFRWLSNFWTAPIYLDGAVYPTVEHAYQAAKTFNREEREVIRNSSTPGNAKRLGKTVTLRPDWSEMTKLVVMEILLRQKFQAHSYLASKLIATKDRDLIEGNKWGDTFWGVSNGKGFNHLGVIIMRIRKELK